MFHFDLFNIVLGIVNVILALILSITFILIYQDSTIQHNYNYDKKDN